MFYDERIDCFIKQDKLYLIKDSPKTLANFAEQKNFPGTLAQFDKSKDHSKESDACQQKLSIF